MADDNPKSLADRMRERPGMYIGDSDPHPLLWELIANCVDLELGGRPLSLEVEVHEDGSISVTDDGPGIGLSLEQLLVHGHTTPTADGHAPHVHLYGPGLGLACIGALSERVDVCTRRGFTTVRQSVSRGLALGGERVENGSPTFGTRVQFWPDPEIFGRFRWDLGLIQRRLHELAALRRQIGCRFVGAQRYDASLDMTSLFPNMGYPTLHETAILGELTRDHITARIALRWYPRSPWSEPQLRSFCNLIETHGGMHVTGFERGIGRVLAQIATIPFGTAWRPAYERVCGCLVAVVAVELLDPKWTAPIKDNPSNPELGDLVTELLLTELPPWFEQHPEVLAAIR